MILITSLSSAITQASEPFIIFFFFLTKHPQVFQLFPTCLGFRNIPQSSGSSLETSPVCSLVHLLLLLVFTERLLGTSHIISITDTMQTTTLAITVQADKLGQRACCRVCCWALLINPNWEIRAASMNTGKMSPIRLAETEEVGCRKESEPEEMLRWLLQPHLCYSVVAWPWAKHLTSLSLSFFICKMGIIILIPRRGKGELPST